MDRLDVKIVTYLQKDGNSTNAGIARKVGVSEENCASPAEEAHE